MPGGRSQGVQPEVCEVHIETKPPAVEDFTRRCFRGNILGPAVYKYICRITGCGYRGQTRGLQRKQCGYGSFPENIYITSGSIYSFLLLTTHTHTRARTYTHTHNLRVIRPVSCVNYCLKYLICSYTSKLYKANWSVESSCVP